MVLEYCFIVDLILLILSYYREYEIPIFSDLVKEFSGSKFDALDRKSSVIWIKKMSTVTRVVKPKKIVDRL